MAALIPDEKFGIGFATEYFREGEKGAGLHLGLVVPSTADGTPLTLSRPGRHPSCPRSRSGEDFGVSEEEDQSCTSPIK